LTQRLTIPFGPLRLDRPEGGLDDGALVGARGVRPVGPAASMEYEVVGTPLPVFPGLDGVAWGALHVRQQPASRESTGPAAALARLVVVRTAEDGVALDPPELQVFDWDEREDETPLPFLGVTLPAGIPSGGRLHGSLVQMGPLAIVALATSERPGGVPVPLETYVLHDDTAVPLGAIVAPTPSITAVTTLAEDSNRAWRPGIVVLRACYRTAWGPLPAGPPIADFIGVPAGPPAEPAAPHSLDLNVSIPGLPDALRDVVTGWEVYASVSSYTLDDAGGSLPPSARQALAGPFRRVATGAATPPPIGFTDGANVDDVLLPIGGLDTAPALDDADLAYARVRAVTGLTFNGRAVLGGVSLDYPAPQFRITTGGTGVARLAVEIETLNGVIQRFGPTFVADTTTNVLVRTSNNDVCGYPDRRARRLTVYHQRAAGGGGTEWARGASFELYAPPTSNLAALILDDDLFGTFGSPPPGGGAPALTDAEIDALNAQTDHDSNRLLAGEVGSVYAWPAARSLQVGDGPDDAVVALRSTAQPVSSGQFGQYPLLALTRRRPQLIQTGTDVFFLGARPAGWSRGVWGDAGAATVEGAIVATSLQDGRAFTPLAELAPFTEAIGDEYGRYAELFRTGAALGVLETARGAEVWATSTDPDVPGVVCMAPTGLWYEREGNRVGWIQVSGIDGIPSGGLLGIDVAGRLWAEDAGTDEVSVGVETAPLALGVPGERKRLFRARVHQRPPLSALFLAVTEELARTVPSELPDDEQLLGDLFASAVDGAVVHFYEGSMVRPRFLVWGAGRRGQRLSHVTSAFDARPRRALGAGVRYDD